jgi:hypothetical protein
MIDLRQQIISKMTDVTNMMDTFISCATEDEVLEVAVIQNECINVNNELILYLNAPDVVFAGVELMYRLLLEQHFIMRSVIENALMNTLELPTSSQQT